MVHENSPLEKNCSHIKDRKHARNTSFLRVQFEVSNCQDSYQLSDQKVYSNNRGYNGQLMMGNCINYTMAFKINFSSELNNTLNL